ncbi:hypothetical protein CPB84DRAFT_1768080 [Gymnopilus junonius]|uniref:Secreted protein n=1 Tax=Gymnopilus junonius TaxID=109634 RepID=A0A9P5NY85_GYMJU|nr:hypothetical protein CPB84DRAFT_1768080 [Gymnopilus junonius]
MLVVPLELALLALALGRLEKAGQGEGSAANQAASKSRLRIFSPHFSARNGGYLHTHSHITLSSSFEPGKP